ncbi:HAD-IA family hydrolase [Leifsonia aquatica]|uniref:HAD-IA family hydrolase n=1 Tax=Leifsonia aquatica TaxID=144185 RepID=UPI00046A58BD|nr:HAD-IA family hydrolase [Leifsonia aquatica]
MLFVFDMDNVLYEYDWRRRMAGMSRLTGLSLDELRERWWHREGEWAAEAGAFADEAVYLGALQSALRVPVTEEDFLRIRGDAMTPWPTSLRAVERAAELGTATLLTNNGPLVARRLSRLAPELVPILGVEHMRASSDYGARKPDPVVYERVLERYGSTPEETFFADDLVENVESAAGLGIHAHLFRTPAGLLEAVEQAGELVA